MEALHMKLHRVRITWYLAVNVYTSLSKKKKKRERETENEFVRCSTHGTLKSWQSKTKGWWKLILKIIGKINSTGTKETMEHKQNPELNLHGEDGKSS